MTEGAAHAGAGVRKPPREMLWGGGEDIATIVADVEPIIVPGVERQPSKKLAVDESALLKLLHRDEPARNGLMASLVMGMLLS
jgi:hypothetical protein